MSTELCTRAELRSAAPELIGEIMELTTRGEAGRFGVTPSSFRSDGTPLFDKSAVLIAADVIGCEKRLKSRGELLHSGEFSRSQQYHSARRSQ